MTDRSRESSQLIKTLAQVRLLEDREPRNWSGGGGLEMVVVVMVVVVMLVWSTGQVRDFLENPVGSSGGPELSGSNFPWSIQAEHCSTILQLPTIPCHTILLQYHAIPF